LISRDKTCRLHLAAGSESGSAYKMSAARFIADFLRRLNKKDFSRVGFSRIADPIYCVTHF
jgi:hypothetical protein